METLYTPWRFAYVSGNDPDGACFFCAAARDPDDPERLVVHRSAHHQVILNRHPYSSGHLMVAPLDHLASPRLAPEAARAEFWPLVLQVQDVLERAYAPHGLNMGLNLGRAGGAGVPSHYHFHIVPRWEGDTNFMSVVSGVRLVPEDPRSAWDRLRSMFAEAEGS
jgi:ATP adenylyltransferase